VLASVLLTALTGCGSKTEPSASGPIAGPTSAASLAPSPSRTPNPPSAGPVATPLPAGVTPCPGTAQVGNAMGRAGSARSSNWSGYVARAAQPSLTCIEATWTQPSVRCPSKGSRTVAFWVGLGGVGQQSLEQIGTQSSCTDGRELIVVWHESLPRERAEVVEPLDVHTGDQIWAQVRWLGGARYRLTIVDITHPQQISVTDTNSRLRRTSAEWVVEAPTGGCPTRCHVLSMPNFGRFRFTGTFVSAEGVRRPLNGVGFTHERETMVTSTGAVRSVVSSTASDGASFTVEWKRA